MKMQSVPVAETLQSEHFSLHTNFQPLSFHFLRKNRAIFRNLNQHSNCIEQKKTKNNKTKQQKKAENKKKLAHNSGHNIFEVCKILEKFQFSTSNGWFISSMENIACELSQE